MVLIGAGVAAAGGLRWAGVYAGLLAGLALVSLFVAHPRLAYWGLILWAPLNAVAYPFVRTNHSFALFTFDRVWISALALALVTRILCDEKRAPRSTRPLAIVALIFVATYGLRAAASPGGTPALSDAKTWVDAILLPIALIFLARDAVRSRRDVWRLLGAMTLAGALLALIAIGERVLSFELATRSGGTPFYDSAIGLIRVSGPYPDPEVLAAALLSCVAATIAWIQLRTGRWDLPVGLAALVLDLVGVGITYFRAAWIGAILIGVIAVVFGPIRPGKLAGVAGRVRRPAVAVAGTAALAAVAVVLLANSHAVTTRLSNSNNVVGRVATYEQDVKVWTRAPVIGVGVNNFTKHTSQRDAVTVGGVAALRQPHNSYLGLLAEQGAVGFLPFLALTVAVWWLCRRYRRTARRAADKVLAAALIGGGIGYLIMSLTLTMLPYGPSNSMLALLIGAAAGRFDRLTVRTPEPPVPGVTSPSRPSSLAAR